MSYETNLYPESYAPWLSKRFPMRITESLATCNQCAMVQPSGLTRDPGPFDPNLKCCTYFPFIPNFAIGGMLETGSHEIRTRINVAEANGLLLPLGLFASPEHESKIAAAGSEGFGKRPELLCPFFDTFSRGCSIWNFRPGVCTTYFCKSERGENGLAFWADLESYLNHFEWTLANAVLWQLGLTEDDTELCEAAMLTDSAGDERDILLRAAWAGWADRKETFFIESWRCALQMNGDELSSLLGDEALVMEKSLLSRSQRDAESER